MSYQQNPCPAGGSNARQASFHDMVDPHDHPYYWTHLLTPEQVAERLELSRATVYLLLRGPLPSVTIGRARRVVLGDLARFVASRRKSDQ